MRELEKEIRVAHLCCGSGFGALGFRKASVRVGNVRGVFRNIGGVDVDPAGIRDFERFSGVKGTLMDLMSLEQYRAFHGKEPPLDWREATPADIHRAFGYERPHIVFISAPCKGFSGLLSEKMSKHAKYQALNALTLRAVWLLMEAFKDDPVELILFENVPRIANRGRPLLDKIQALYRSYNYAYAETSHDCGEIGNLAQSRKRFLMIARHMEKVPNFIYEPPKLPLRPVGDILSKLPMPGDERAGPMHRIPRLQWKTWVRLAFVEAGSDWRSLNKLAVEDGVLRDFGIVPDRPWRDGALGVLDWQQPSGAITAQAEATTGRYNVADPRPEGDGWQKAVLGVREWKEPSGTVTGRGTPTTGAFSIADPRAPKGSLEYSQYGVRGWDESSGSVINVKAPGQGTFSVADPRHSGPAKHNNEYRIVRWGEQARSVTGAHGKGQCVADPSPAGSFEGAGKYRVTSFGEPAGTVISGSTTGQGAFAVQDPRPAAFQDGRQSYKTQGHYGVLRWQENSGAVPSFAKYDRGSWSVADPRAVADASFDVEKINMPAPDDRLICRITALDGTWHRPFTTLELAALQSLFDPEEWFGFHMDGQSDSAWRERIGNAVPPDAAENMAIVFGRTLLLAWAGETFSLSSDPIWVQPITIALAVDQSGFEQ